MHKFPLQFVTAALCACTVALAQQASPLRLELSQSLVQTVKEGGKTVEKLLAVPASVAPGAQLQDDLLVTNSGKTLLRDVRPQLRIDPGLLYLSQSGAPEGTLVEFSFDGGKTFGVAPLKRKVSVTENGKSVVKEVEVPPSEYTTIRWTLPTLDPAQSVKLSVRLRVK